MFTRKLTKKEMSVLEKVINFVSEKHMKQCGHDYSHVLEVCRWAIEIGNKIKEPIDPFITVCGALLHDIGRIGAEDGSFHGIDGGARAEEFLECLIEDEETVRKIAKLVVRHTPTSMILPRSVEEKVVCDADGIERLGLMGMVRGIMNKKGSMAYIIKDRIRKRLGDFDKLFFKESKELAEPYYRETLAIVESLEKALEKRLEQIEQIDSFQLIREEM